MDRRTDRQLGIPALGSGFFLMQTRQTLKRTTPHEERSSVARFYTTHFYTVLFCEARS